MNITNDGAALAKGQGKELLSIRIGAQEFAIDIMSVREIRGWIASTPLPHAPSYIKGMVNLRGVILPIIDLAERLNFEAKDPNASSVVVVVETAGRIVGLLVDAVCDIITVTDDMIQGTPDVGSEAAIEIVQGLITLEGRIVSIISIPAIMPEGLPETMPVAA
jgi:purine-binding chemotaxis protein CheW